LRRIYLRVDKSARSLCAQRSGLAGTIRYITQLSSPRCVPLCAAEIRRRTCRVEERPKPVPHRKRSRWLPDRWPRTAVLARAPLRKHGKCAPATPPLQGTRGVRAQGSNDTSKRTSTSTHTRGRLRLQHPRRLVHRRVVQRQRRRQRRQHLHQHSLQCHLRRTGALELPASRAEQA